MAVKQKERVQFDFSTEALQRLDAIKEQTGAATRAEVVRNALKVYEWLISEISPDSTIEVVDKNNKSTTKFKANLLLK